MRRRSHPCKTPGLSISMPRDSTGEGPRTGAVCLVRKCQTGLWPDVMNRKGEGSTGRRTGYAVRCLHFTECNWKILSGEATWSDLHFKRLFWLLRGDRLWKERGRAKIRQEEVLFIIFKGWKQPISIDKWMGKQSGISIWWNIMQPYKRRKFWYRPHPEWT